MERALGGADPAPADILDTTEAGPAVIRGGAIRAVGYAAAVALSVVSAAILIRHLGAADFGRYTTVVSLITLVGGLTEVGMTNLGVREYTIRTGEDRDLLMRSLLGLRIVLTMAGIVIATAFCVLAGYESAMVVGAVIAGVALLETVAQGSLGVALQARLRLGWITAVDLTRHVVILVLTVVLVLLGAGIVPLIGVQVPAALAALGVTVVLVRGTIPLVPAFDRASWVRLLRVTLPFALAAAVGVIYVYLAIVLMSIVSTETETGYFGASFRVFMVLSGIGGLMVAVAFPVLSRAARDDATRFAYALQRLSEVSLIIGVWITLATILGAEVAIDVVAGEGFEPSVSVLQVQAGALLGSFLVAAWGFALLSLHKYRALLAANGVVLVVSAGLTLALAPSHGADGAAISTLAGESLLAVGYAVGLMAKRPDLRPSLAIVPRVALAAAVGALVVLIPASPPLVDTALASVAYLGLLVALRAVPQEIWDAVPLRVRR